MPFIHTDPGTDPLCRACAVNPLCIMPKIRLTKNKIVNNSIVHNLFYESEVFP